MSKKWLAILAVALVILSLLSVLGISALRAQMETALSRACQRPVTVRSAGIALPLGIRLIGIHVPPSRTEPNPPLSVEQLEIQVALGSVFNGRPALALEIVQPQFSIPWNRQVREVLRKGGIPGGVQPPVPIASMRIRDGRIRVVDEDVVPPVRWDFRGLQAALEARSDRHYTFQISGELEGQGQTQLGDLAAEGDFFPAGPMEAKIKLNHEKVGLLAPYLRKILGTTPDQGTLQLSSQFTVHEGVLMSHHEVTAAHVRFPNDQPTTLGLEGNRLVELLADREGKVHLSFMVNGRMDGELDGSDLAAGAMREALRQAMARSIQRTLDAAQQQPLEERLRKQMDSLGR